MLHQLYVNLIIAESRGDPDLKSVDYDKLIGEGDSGLYMSLIAKKKLLVVTFVTGKYSRYSTILQGYFPWKYIYFRLKCFHYPDVKGQKTCYRPRPSIVTSAQYWSIFSDGAVMKGAKLCSNGFKSPLTFH